MTRRILFGLLLSLPTLLPSNAEAQVDTASTHYVQLLQRVRPGTNLQLLLSSGSVFGRLRAVTLDSVHLEEQAFPMRDVQRVWLQQRSTRQGMKLGALVGAPAGAAAGAFIIWIANALCESSCDGLTFGELALGTLGFSAFGLVAGGTVGAVVGAAIPRWIEITDERARLPERADSDRPASRTIGSIAVMPVYARFSDSDAGGLGGRISYAFQTPHIALGLEAGRYEPGTTERQQLLSCDTGLCVDTVAVGTGVVHGGGIARLGTGAHRRLEPYASVGLGFYSWDFDDGGSLFLGGYSLGGGIQLRNRTGRRSAFAEARWQSNLTRSGDTTDYGFYTIGIGASFAW